ncbi:PhzF family phenazine biosynthesis protein [Erythrobacter mangrovi]|uniref:PhzF family phenazine biosynthesis protein n=1 Tax=Erythrobacter mangrovi TaxID=2739433 RepID=A0A7D4BWD2_9SPHN|nr:PhzF family phenazine biosynthesis protein [Erythrobacter mangrovi]QKG71867.1 PhzF family phenazine biosynthesis protein [Erythrobacter mangrovi]
MMLDLVDVFASAPLSGNPLGVVHDGEGLDTETMHRLTCWLGFSEATFLCPPTDPAADYRLRIFYPGGELPFAGHPTLGSCHAWLAAGGKPKRDGVVVQECGAGLIEIRVKDGAYAFRAPPLTRSGPLSEEERLAAIAKTGVDPEAVVEAVHAQNGPGWQVLRLRSAADVLAAKPMPTAPTGTDIGLAGPCEPGAAADWELRAFFGDHQGRFREDPVTGSFNAGVAQHLFDTGLASGHYRAAQGRMTGADGLVDCTREVDGSTWIGGRCYTIASQARLGLP